MAKLDTKNYMLTTFDNPFNPFKDFESWYKYDFFILGYDSCGLLARTSNVSDVSSDEINENSIDEAMDEICRNNPTMYKKVSENDYL